MSSIEDDSCHHVVSTVVPNVVFANVRHRIARGYTKRGLRKRAASHNARIYLLWVETASLKICVRLGKVVVGGGGE